MRPERDWDAVTGFEPGSCSFGFLPQGETSFHS